MKTGKSFIKRNIEWLILAIVMLCMHVLYLFLIGHPEGDLIYVGILDLCIIAFALCIAYIRYDRKVRYLKDMLQQRQMAGAGNGQKFRHALHKAQNNGSQYRHENISLFSYCFTKAIF